MKNNIGCSIECKEKIKILRRKIENYSNALFRKEIMV